MNELRLLHANRSNSNLIQSSTSKKSETKQHSNRTVQRGQSELTQSDELSFRTPLTELKSNRLARQVEIRSELAGYKPLSAQLEAVANHAVDTPLHTSLTVEHIG